MTVDIHAERQPEMREEVGKTINTSPGNIFPKKVEWESFRGRFFHKTFMGKCVIEDMRMMNMIFWVLCGGEMSWMIESNINERLSDMSENNFGSLLCPINVLYF